MYPFKNKADERKWLSKYEVGSIQLDGANATEKFMGPPGPSCSQVMESLGFTLVDGNWIKEVRCDNPRMAHVITIEDGTDLNWVAAQIFQQGWKLGRQRRKGEDPL